jgi:hypothetical protein
MFEEGRHSGDEEGGLLLSLEASRLRHALPLVVRRAMGFTARHRFDDLLIQAVRAYYGMELDLRGVEQEILDDDDERIRFLPWFLWDWRASQSEPSVGEQFLVTCDHAPLDERLLQGLCDSYVGFYVALDHAQRTGVWLRDLATGKRLHVADEGLEDELFEGQVLQARLVRVDMGGDDLHLIDAVYSVLPEGSLDKIKEELATILSPGLDPTAEMKDAAAELIEFAEHLLESLSRPNRHPAPGGDPLVLCQTKVKGAQATEVLLPVLDAEVEGFRAVNPTTWSWTQDGRVSGFVAREADERWVLGALSQEAYESMRRAVDPEGALHVPFHSLTDIEAVAERWVTSGGGERWLALFPQVGEALRDWLAAWTRSWVDRPTGALGHRTPREAARRAKGRRQVERLVRDIEASHGSWFHAEDAADLTGLRAVLDLEPV